MKKRRTHKAIKALTLFSSLELMTVLWWEKFLGMDSVNTPFTDSSKIIFWGTFASVCIGFLFWVYLKQRSKKWRRRHVFANVEKELTGITDSQA